MWTGGNRGSADMNPGRACITCHSTMNGPSLTIAGTVYPTAHEPDLCNGANGYERRARRDHGRGRSDAHVDTEHVGQFQLPDRREDAVQGEGHVHGPRARDGRVADVGRLQQLPHADRREQRAGPNPPTVSAGKTDERVGGAVDQLLPGPATGAVRVGSGVAGGRFCGGSSFTSLGTITPRPVSGTGGGAASAGVGTSRAVRGGGSLTGAGLQAHNHPAPTNRTRRRMIDAGVIAQSQADQRCGYHRPSCQR